MELRHLRYFVAVVDAGSVTEAAAQLNLSQPSLSRQLKVLERQLGVPLLVRDAWGSRPTPAGRELARRAVRLLADADAAVVATRRVSAVEDQRLHVGVLAYAPKALVHGLLAELRRTRPETILTTSPVTVGDRLDEVRSGKLDAAFVRLAAVDDPDLDHLLLLEENLLAALPEDHPLAAQETVGLDELGREPLAFYPRDDDPDWYDAVMAAFESTGRRPSVTRLGTTAFDNLPLVAAGQVVTLVSESLAAAIAFRGVVLRPLHGPAPVLPLGLVWRRASASPPLLALVAAARSVADG